MEYSKRVESILNEQIMMAYKDYLPEIVTTSDGLTNYITIKDFVFKGVNLSCYGSRIDYCFAYFDLMDYLNLEAYLKPRLCFDNAKYYFNKRKINCYLYKDFALTEKGAFEDAMYRFRAIEQFKDVIVDLDVTFKK